MQGYVDKSKPLKPLTAHALAELAEIDRAPVPCSAVNPGVADRLKREGLIEVVQKTSPFKIHKGKMCAHWQLTAAGKAKLYGK